MAKKTRPNTLTLALSNDEYNEARDRANELEITIQEYLRQQIWGDNQQEQLLKCLIKLERIMSRFHQDFRMVYFPD